MKRNKFSLSHYRLSTLNFGQLIPIMWIDVLPGDTIQHRVNALLRMTPLTAPVMHPVKVRIHNWFVPNRIIWDEWEDYITGGESGTLTPEHPNVTVDEVTKGSLLDHLGMPALDYIGSGGATTISALPLRAYASIYNEFYRDQDLITRLAIGKASGADTETPQDIQFVAWEKDYMTSARPWPAKGDEILIPIGDTAPVVPTGNSTPEFEFGTAQGIVLEDGSSSTNISRSGTSAATTDSMRWYDPKLEADLASVTGISVNDLRNFLAQQRFQEARAQFGSRYSEYLRYLAPGIGNLDARLQEPEFLGGGASLISHSEVLQTSETGSGTPLAEMAGHGVAAMRTRRYRRFIPEHGIVMSLLSIVPKAVYQSQIERKWIRAYKEDYFQKELQFIGEQPILNREVQGNHSQRTGVFGYQQRYDEYRYSPSTIAGDFNDDADNWHYARIFGSDVALNRSFIECNPPPRPSADQVGDRVYAMINHSIQARRILTKWPKPRTF